MLKMMLIANPITSWFNNQIHRFLLWLDQSVYWLAAQCYQLFMKLATAQIFTDDFFSNFAKRIYAILGVFMLFYLVYALLNAIVDPDKLTKGDQGAGKIAINLVVSLTLLGLLPSIFGMAYRLQNFILSSNLLGAIILGSDVVDVSDSNAIDANDASLVRFGDYVSFTVLNSFLNPENANPSLDGGYNWYGIKKEILEAGTWLNLPLMSDAVSNGVSIDGNNVVVTYRPIVSTAAGIFLVYVLLSFTLDLGIRVVKFAFYQLIAPIPIILRIIPSKKGTFDKWLKQTLSVYFEVFVRVGLMFIAIYFINAITTNNSLMNLWTDSMTGKLALAIIIMGVFAFAKQAPKLISDVLGIDTGNIKLGITDKLKARGPIGQVLNKGIGTVSGSLGGLSTGIFDKNVNTWAAMRQGAAAGFKSGGAQYSKQRAKTFESAYGYGVEQGLFGGKSIGQRMNDVNKNNVINALKQKRNEIVNTYEKTEKFRKAFQYNMNSGAQFDRYSTNIQAGEYSDDFDAANKAARRFAQQLGINFSDKRAQDVRKKYLQDIMNTTTDENKKRAINSVLNAEEMSALWAKKLSNGQSWNAYANMTDAQINATTTLSIDDKATVKALKAEWLQNAKNYTESLADGTYTRKTDGMKDELFNKNYAEAHNPTEVKKESDSDLLRKLLNK